jgi:regulatory protein
MVDNLKYRRALAKAMAICSQSEQCRSDIAAKLRLWELSEGEIAEMLDSLVKEGFVDEERFACFYVNDKLRFNKWGRVKMSFMLRQKQIPEDIILDALNQISDDLYSTTLHDLLKSKIKYVKGASDYERKGRLAVFAQSHGFEAGPAFRIADELINADK